MGTSPPLVSVVLAAYQHADYVERAVRSVLEQSLGDLELIVVDDASVDGTADVVAAIADPRLRLLRAPANRAWHCRNKGLALARGAYVAFQCSDDEWAPDKLALQLETLRGDPGVVAAFTHVELIDARGRRARGGWASEAFIERDVPGDARGWLRLLFERNVLCLSSAVVLRRALDDAGPFDASLLQLSDLDLWIRLAARGRFEVVPRPLTRMRVLGRRNLSAPSAAAQNRVVLEQADLLRSYLEPPIFDDLHRIFPEAELPDASDPALRRAAFARFCGARGLAHRLFADRVLAALFADPGVAARLQEGSGGEMLKGFWAARGRLKLVDAERYARRTRSLWDRLRSAFGRSP